MVIGWRDRYDNLLGTVRAFAATYSAATDGTDELTLLTPDALEKGQRLLWRDDNDRITGLVHEMIVSSVRTVHDKRGKALNEVKAINSIAELYWTDVPKASGIYVPHYTGQTDSQGNPIQNGWMLPNLMQAILDGTRWSWVRGGTFDIGGEIEYVGMRETYDVSVREIIAAAVAGFNGAELRTYVFAEDDGTVTYRYVSIAYPTAGSSVEDLDVKGRFVYSKNMTGVTRDVGDSECYTAVRVIGSDILDDTGAVTGRHEVYLESQNPDHLAAWGKPMPDGTIGHSVYTINTSSEDDSELLVLAAETLEDLVTPDVTYTIEIADAHDIRLRDYVDVIDETFPGTLRMRARVTSIKQDLLNESRGGTVTIGKTMNYAAVATSYQSNNAVTASSVTDSAKTNRVASSGRSTDSTASRVTTAEHQIANLNERVNSGGGGGGVSWPLIANKGWWNSDDSFAFFNKGGQFAVTGKDNNLGVYAAADGLTPDPQNQQWNEGSEVWKALSGTDARTRATGFFLHAVNAAAQFFRFTSDPTSSHIFTKLLNAGLRTTNGMRGLGFFYTGHSSTSGSTTTDAPFLVIEPHETAAGAPGVRLKTPTTITNAAGFLNGFPFFDLQTTTGGSSYMRLQSPTLYNTTSSSPNSRAIFELDGRYESSEYGTGTSDLTIRGQDSNGQGIAMLHGSSSPSNPYWELRVNPSTSSGYAYDGVGLRIDRTGIYAVSGSYGKTPLHTF